MSIILNEMYTFGDIPMIYQPPLILQQLTESVNAANVDDDVDHVAAELVGLHIHRRGVGCNVDLNKLSHD